MNDAPSLQTGNALKPAAAQCPLCAGDEPRMLYRSDAPFMRVVRCARCGMMYQSPRIPESEMEDAYKALDDYRHYESLEGAKWKLFACKLREIQRERTLARAGSFLDIGASRGVMLDVMRAQLPEWRLLGVEISPSARAALAARGYETLETIDALDASMKFDWINLDNVLEHMPEPLEVLARLRKHLNPGGFIYIDVPNESFFGMRYRINDLVRGFAKPPTFPGHINLFTSRTLKAVIAAAGYRHQTFRFVSLSEPYRLEGGVGAVETPRVRAAFQMLRATRLDTVLHLAYFLSATIEPVEN